MIKDLIPLIIKKDPSSVNVILEEKTVLLDPYGKTNPYYKVSDWKKTFNPCFILKLDGWISDNGTHIGYYAHIWIAEVNQKHKLFDIHPATFDMFGAWRPATNPGLTLRDLSNGLYAVDADYTFSPFTVPRPYDLHVTYPTQDEIEKFGDVIALSNYGEPVEVHLAFHAYEIVDMQRFILAVRSVLSELGIGRL